MIGNIFISSALVVVVIFSTGALFKSLSDIKEAKEIQEHYEIVKDIKTLLAKQYNKNIEEITRDDIIANLPQGGNWEKVLLLDRQKDSKLSNTNKSFINEKANIEISEDEKLKLLALKAKLKDIIDVNNLTLEDKKYKINVGANARNIISQDKDFEDSLKRVINYLSTKVLYGTTYDKTEELSKTIELDKFFNFNNINIEEENKSEEQIKKEKEIYIEKKIYEKLQKSENSVEMRLYEKMNVKGKL